ncbi:MAG: glycosyltransferase [Prevotella sp.]|jgi:glycosyltransferase involved in cell wall biosynthesis|nr:glycosyltransferase [Prevotella sp.]
MDFSVLIPIYHKEDPKHLRECFDSIFGQTLPATEIILVEDGPLTTELYDTISEYQHNHPELKTIQLPENGGIGHALNEGLKHCSYDLVARMDADDICKPDRFEAQVRFMESHPKYDIVGSWADEFSDSISNILSTRKLPEDHEAIIQFSKKRNPMNHPTVMFRHQAVKAAGYYINTPQVEDYDLWVRMILKDCQFYNIQRSLLYFRMSDDFARRRGGWNYSRREIPLQISFYKKGYISWWRMAQNITIRTIIRMLPSHWRRKIYLRLLR